MTTKTFSTPTLNEVMKEINKRAQQGYLVASGPEFADGMYTVTFTGGGDAEPEVVEVVPPAPKPIAPAEAKPEAPKRGPKPKAKTEVKEPVEA